MKMMRIFRQLLLEGNVPQYVYHGGDMDNLKSLYADFKIVSPEEKMQFASTGGGYFGLSTSRDKSKAKRYSQVFGNDYVLKIKVLPSATFHAVDTGGDGIDQVFDQSELEEFGKSGKDAVVELDDLAESEIRILRPDKFKPVAIEK